MSRILALPLLAFLFLAACDDSPAGSNEPPASADGRWRAGIRFSHDTTIVGNLGGQSVERTFTYRGDATLTLTLEDSGGVVTGTLEQVESSDYLITDRDRVTHAILREETSSTEGFTLSATLDARYASPVLHVSSVSPTEEDDTLSGVYGNMDIEFVDAGEGRARAHFCGRVCPEHGPIVNVVFRRQQ